MDFDFSEEQNALRDSVRTTLSRALPHDRLREVIDKDQDLPADVWDTFVSLGWVGLLVPEEYGGLGLGLVDMDVVMEEMGRVALPGPFFASAVLATLAARALNAESLLRALADGSQRGAVALEEVATADDPIAAVQARASHSGEAWTLDGLKPHVLDGAGADWVIVVAREPSGVAGFLVEQPAMEAVPTLDPTRRAARLELSGVRAVRLGPDGDQSVLWRRVLDDAGVMLCAELVGCCDAAFDLTSDYAKARVQFSRPIGTFQAVKHIAADMLRDLTLARVGTHWAAWASDAGVPEREYAAAMAKAWVAEAAVHVTGDAIQIHGGVGFTWESDAHLYYKRAKTNDLLLGRQAWQRSRVADLILGPATATGG